MIKQKELLKEFDKLEKAIDKFIESKFDEMQDIPISLSDGEAYYRMGMESARAFLAELVEIGPIPKTSVKRVKMMDNEGDLEYEMYYRTPITERNP